MDSLSNAVGMESNPKKVAKLQDTMYSLQMDMDKLGEE